MNVPCYLAMSRLNLCTNLRLFCSQWKEWSMSTRLRFSTGWTVKTSRLRFSSGRCWPDWAFVMVDFDRRRQSTVHVRLTFSSRPRFNLLSFFAYFLHSHVFMFVSADFFCHFSPQFLFFSNYFITFDCSLMVGSAIWHWCLLWNSTKFLHIKLHQCHLNNNNIFSAPYKKFILPNMNDASQPIMINSK